MLKLFFKNLKFNAQDLNRFDSYQTKLFVMLMEDIFEYKIKKVSTNKIRKARSIINNYFMSSYIKYDCLIKFTLYLYNPTKLISEEDMKFYKYWISTLNPVFY